MALFITQHSNIKAKTVEKIVIAHSASKVAKILKNVNIPRAETHTFSFWKLSDNLDLTPSSIPAVIVFFDSLDEMKDMVEDDGLDVGDLNTVARKSFAKSAEKFTSDFSAEREGARPESDIESGFIYFFSIDGRNTSSCFTFEEFGEYIISQFFPSEGEAEKEVYFMDKLFLRLEAMCRQAKRKYKKEDMESVKVKGSGHLKLTYSGSILELQGKSIGRIHFNPIADSGSYVQFQQIKDQRKIPFYPYHFADSKKDTKWLPLKEQSEEVQKYFAQVEEALGAFESFLEK